MEIRRASQGDLEGINRLLRQVLLVHHQGRPDLFKSEGKKYSDEELIAIIADDRRPVFVAVEGSEMLGYAFCIFEERHASHALTDIKTLYIDDLCVEKAVRGQHIGAALYEFVRQFARRTGCYNLTLNVWCCNGGAMEFYKKMGLVPQKIGMEELL